MQGYAAKALEAGNEDDARKFLEKKVSLLSKQPGLSEAYEIARTNAARMREMHDKLVEDIRELESEEI